MSQKVSGGKKDLVINVNGGGAASATDKVGIAKSAFNAIANAKWSTIAKVYLVILVFMVTIVVGIFAYTASRNEEIVKQTAHRMATTQKEENIRDFVVTPKIQHELQKLVYTINADRAFLFELHNGKKNTSGLPFRFADMTYEEVNEDKKVDKVAMQFQDIPLTLYKYPHYLQRQKVMIGTVEEINNVDPDFAAHIRDVGGKYLGMIYLSTRGIPIGFLCVSYHDMNDVPSVERIDSELRKYDMMVTQLLDLQCQMSNDIEM